jgi:hypothetical protein
MYGKLLVRASIYISRDNKMADYYLMEETVGACAETATTIISAVCAEQFSPNPLYQTCRFHVMQTCAV